MKITFHDDKKGKYQSWSAHAAFNGSDAMWWFDFEITAYGATKEEALANFKVAKAEMTTKIGDFWEVDAPMIPEGGKNMAEIANLPPRDIGRNQPTISRGRPTS